jgi:hypothetical protein
MVYSTTCNHCGWTFGFVEVRKSSAVPCPRCGAEVFYDAPTRGSLAGVGFPVRELVLGLLLVVTVTSPCCCLPLSGQEGVKAVECLVSAAVPVMLVFGGLMLWGIARELTSRLLTPGWALLVNVALAALWAAAVLLVAASAWFVWR